MAEEEVKFYPLVWLVPNGFDFDSEETEDDEPVEFELKDKFY